MKNLIKKILSEMTQDGVPKQSNLDRIIDLLGQGFDQDLLDKIKSYVKSHIQQKGYTVKFLNSCSTGFAGVRTKKQVILCSPATMSSLGDFIYTIFHELRHEEQMTSLKMQNPLSDMDLEDFENLYEQYWKLEMDADKTAKEQVAKMVSELSLPIEKAKTYFKLSHHIENYQFCSNSVKEFLRGLIMDIVKMKKGGIEYNDIQDHPIVKKHLDKLEEFI